MRFHPRFTLTPTLCSFYVPRAACYSSLNPTRWGTSGTSGDVVYFTVVNQPCQSRESPGALVEPWCHVPIMNVVMDSQTLTLTPCPFGVYLSGRQRGILSWL